MITKICRSVSREERDFIVRDADAKNFGCDTATLSSVLSVVEYRFNINRMLKPRFEFMLCESQELFLLMVDESLALGFERCFMEWSLVSGVFPSDTCHVCFGLADEKVLENWPIAYHWSGKIIPIHDVNEHEFPQLNQVVPVYRSHCLDAALDGQS